ncbi:MAG: hypothetical protein J6V22_02265, partial [Clostridia bacterium]|nr:hypothetical protein [Clostridia bacterium]
LANGELTIDGGNIHDNSATNGGAVFMGGGTLEVGGGRIYENVATDGAGVYLASGTMTMTNGIIDNNTADRYGGGAYLGGGELKIIGGEIHTNTAINGAGAYLTGGTMNMQGGIIGYNTASQNGGGAYLDGGTLNVSGTTLMHYNTATNGAGAYVSGGNVNVFAGTITHNTASQNGGGIAVQNGSYYMIGGNIDYNKAVAGQGGGVFVTASGQPATVEVRSGSISYNEAGIQGGALSVDCDRSSMDEITVTIGVNEKHEITMDGDETVTNVSADHDENGTPEDNCCPIMQGNQAPKQGGAVFVKGGKNTVLNVYCLREFESQVTEVEDSKSVFMKVEGGTINITTADMESDPVDHRATYGYINIQNTVHVTSGDVYLSGMRYNPIFIEDITVDVIEGDGGFYDSRLEDGERFVLIYYENFKNPETGITSGQYIVRQYDKGDTGFISGVIYQHPGFVISGWFTEQNGTGNKYDVGWSYVFDGTDTVDAANRTYHISDLIVYAVWDVNGYSITFLPNPVNPEDTVEGEMPDLEMSYGIYTNLPENQFFYKGYIFVGWEDENGVSYADGANVGNLSDADGITIKFKACWVVCEHNVEQITFSYSATDNSLVRTCSCRAYWQTATVTANSATYDGGEHGASPIVFKTDSDNTFKPNIPWDITVTYETEANVACAVPVNAGGYYAVLEQGGAKATYLYVIHKATQAAPGVPTYRVVDENADPREIIISPSEEDTPYSWQHYEYRIRYLSTGGTFADLDWDELNLKTLEKQFTTYYVYIRYGETENYLPSDEVRAESVYYYSAEVGILIYPEEGLDVWPESGEGIVGVNFHIAAQTGYYRSNVDLTYEAKDTDGNAVTGMVLTRESSALYNLSDIPSNITFTIYVSATGVRKVATVSQSVIENQHFKEVSGDTAHIGRDSAFTAYYEVSNYYAYKNLQLLFTASNDNAAPLPKDTTIILLDLSDRSYWYYRVGDTPESSIPLTSFTKMGETSNDVNNRFVPPTTEAELSYVFVVDFSQTELGYNNADTLKMVLYAEGDTDVEAEVSNLEKKPVTTTLEDVRFEVGVSSTGAGMEQQISVTFASSEAVSSKWNNRGAAVVLTPVSELPKDACITVVLRANQTVSQATYYLNPEGVFIIPISQQITNLTITLKTTMGGNSMNGQEMHYDFRVALYGAYSKASQSPLNGERLTQETRLTFTKVFVPQTSIKITSDQTICDLDSIFYAVVEYDLPETYTVSMRLLRKNDIPDETGYISGEYVDTGFSQDNIFTSDYWTQEATVSNRGTLTVPLGGQMAGSFALVLTVKDDTGVQVRTASYYFILSDID